MNQHVILHFFTILTSEGTFVTGKLLRTMLSNHVEP
jgi:hypothetical protein